jgi:hypothetical protein
MNILQKIRILIQDNGLLRKLVAYYLVPSGLFDKKY